MVELLVGLVIAGIVAGFIALTIASPVEAYVAQSRRLALSDAAETAMRQISAAGCTGVNGQSLPLPQGYNVILACQAASPAQVVNGVSVNVFSVTATATRGLYGTPDFVSRQRTVRITP